MYSPSAKEVRNLADFPPTESIAQLEQGIVPEWLIHVQAASVGDLRVYIIEAARRGLKGSASLADFKVRLGWAGGPAPAI